VIGSAKGKEGLACTITQWHQYRRIAIPFLIAALLLLASLDTENSSPLGPFVSRFCWTVSLHEIGRCTGPALRGSAIRFLVTTFYLCTVKYVPRCSINQPHHQYCSSVGLITSFQPLLVRYFTQTCPCNF
jgi:hypothetical protein